MDAITDAKKLKLTQAARLKQRRVYQRRKMGLRCFNVEVSCGAGVEFLIRSELLDPERANDDKAVAKALTRLLDIVIQDVIITPTEQEKFP
jgi:hypothetical protein